MTPTTKCDSIDKTANEFVRPCVPVGSLIYVQAPKPYTFRAVGTAVLDHYDGAPRPRIKRSNGESEHIISTDLVILVTTLFNLVRFDR